MSVKYVTMGLISKVDKGAYSNIVLNDAFREFFLSPKEKAFMTEIFYGVIRNKKFLDYIIDIYTKDIRKEWIRNLLRISIYQITFMDSDNKGVVWEATELAKKYSIGISKFINGTLRNYLRNKDSELKKLNDEKNYDVLYSIPKWFCDVLEKQYGNENLKQAITSLKKIPYLSVRVNKLKYSEEEFEEFLKEKDIQIIKKVDTVYYVNSGLIINSEEFKAGKIIAQDASSYLAAKNLGVMPNELVLDICAAQGRKFDKILVDVPCSGYGVIRKKPEILYSKNKENVEELAKLQLEILNSAADILKDGGELIYSTCTITNEENTNNIEKFLEERKEFKVEKLRIPESVLGDYDKFGGFCINYKEEIMDNFYIIKLKKGEKC